MSEILPDKRIDALGKLSPQARRLASLLPGIYLARNETLEGRPLFPLLEVLAAPLAELGQAIEQLADDHFVERCSPQALEHIADLVGARLLNEQGAANRGIVARTLHWRRRKGTLSTLEDVLEVTTGWSTEVDEAFRSLLHTQDLAYPVPWRGRNTVLWDPIALSDPLSRRAPQAERPRDAEIERAPTLTRLPHEQLEDTLRRLGRADAGRHAASPRCIDFSGWARPEMAVVRTSRFVQREIDRVVIGDLFRVNHRDDPSLHFTGLQLDPAGRDRPLAVCEPRDSAAATGGLTAAHEPDPAPPPGRCRYGLMTPTTLAADGDGIEQADNLTLTIDGVQLVGQAGVPQDTAPLACQAAGHDAVLRFADLARPSAHEEWRLDLLALDNPSAIAADDVVSADLDEPSAAEENPVLARTTARRGTRQTTFTALSQVPRSGANVGIRLSRPVAGQGYRRDGDGQWHGHPLQPPAGEPLSELALLGAEGATWAVRLTRLAGNDETLVLERNAIDAGTPDWAQVDIDWAGMSEEQQPQRRPLRDGPTYALLAQGDDLLLVGPQADGKRIGVWRLGTALTNEATATRLDSAELGPAARWRAAVCRHGQGLYLFGGEDDTGSILGDLWYLPLSGDDSGVWRIRHIRNRQTRSGGRLIVRGDRLLLLGGATRSGELDPTVFHLDLARSRLRWDEMPSLPLATGEPGDLWASLQDDALEVLFWANRLAPRLARLRLDGRHWQLGEYERSGSPNPPAQGEVLRHGGQWWVMGPPPLPPSELVLRLGDTGHLLFLPAVDLLQTDQWALFQIQTDGSSERWTAAGVEQRPSLRMGAAREDTVHRRQAEQPRLGAIGRLRWTPLKLRQRSLGPWHQPLVLDLEDTVALDPRLGRVLLPGNIDLGRFEASYRIGRSTPLGAGFMPGSNQLDDDWLEPEAALQPPAAPVSDARSLDVLVDPDDGGTTDERRVVRNLSDALKQRADAYLMQIKGSPRFGPQNLAVGDGERVSIRPDASSSYPVVTRDLDGTSLSLQERLHSGSEAAEGPEFQLSGLLLDGGMDVALAAGRLQLRWCDLGTPGETALRVAGSGHESEIGLRSIPQPRLWIWLYGCVLGRIELPPWVQLVAAGCLFDGGSEQDVAIDARGARVRLRHCTVRGKTLAGELAASSCAFQGEVRCNRPDLGWLRYCLLPEGKRQPTRYQSRVHAVSFASVRPTEPNYLVLAPNNGAQALQTGERRRLPGAHTALSTSLTELHARTDEFLPLSLVSYQIDRVAADLQRMNRRES